MYHFGAEKTVRSQMAGLCEFLEMDARRYEQEKSHSTTKKAHEILQARINVLRGIIQDIHNSSAWTME